MKTTVSVTGESRLRRAITGPALFLFILGDVLGAGVYALVGKMAGEAGGAVWVPLLVALGFAMLTAASYAELVTKYPKAGGAAVFAERAFGMPLVSFLVGFCMLAAGVTSAAGLSLAFAGDYLGAFLNTPAIPMALVFLTVIGLLNARGIRESLGANGVMTVIEVSGLLVVVILAAGFIMGGQGEPSRIVQFAPGVSPAIAVLGAALIAFYSFVGFEVSANVAEEVQNVQRNYPRALFGALLVAGLVYVGVGIAATAVLPPDVLAESSAPLLDVVRATGYAVPDWLFAAVALVAVANGALLTMIMSSRLAYGMADEGLLPSILTRVLAERRTPWLAIVLTTLLAMILTVTGTLTALAETVVLLLLFVFMSTNIAVLVLRRDKVAEPHFRTPTVLPVLAIGSCLLLLSQQSGGTWLRAALLMALGAVCYVLGRWQQRRRASAH
ncbi:APC family permease [Pseudomonas sp. SST3]|uniref:APC family permease n=1 Tax=Pseudomonas sp. SST3 TaxID=2267882 RepID=UPI000E083465|nr:APC family permease [Pseudomonas sp. SST3]NKQ11582.1 amino acid permease [Pseudomonas sp. SST3]